MTTFSCNSYVDGFQPLHDLEPTSVRYHNVPRMTDQCCYVRAGLDTVSNVDAEQKNPLSDGEDKKLQDPTQSPPLPGFVYDQYFVRWWQMRSLIGFHLVLG